VAGGWWLVAGGRWLVVSVAGVNRWLQKEPRAAVIGLSKLQPQMAVSPELLRIARGIADAHADPMASLKTYRELEAWQVSMTLVERCYAATRAFPLEERFGLTSQLRRAAISIPSNVAEGACRRTTNAFINHVSIALGSHAELETCVEIATRLGYLSESVRCELTKVSDSVGRLMNGLLHALESRSRAPHY
jgi:four helix bundle protein